MEEESYDFGQLDAFNTATENAPGFKPLERSCTTLRTLLPLTTSKEAILKVIGRMEELEPLHSRPVVKIEANGVVVSSAGRMTDPPVDTTEAD